jgi:hypothetical protein
VSTDSPDDFFASLSVYLTLERAQRLYGFDAAKYGLDDATAAEIAAVFGRVGMLRRGKGGGGGACVRFGGDVWRVAIVIWLVIRHTFVALLLLLPAV